MTFPVPQRPPGSGGGGPLPPPRPEDFDPDKPQPLDREPAEGTGLDQGQQDAYALLVSMLSEWGLESLGQTVYDLLIQGYSQDNISLLLRDTDAYKQRFAGNEARRAKGLAVLSPREYLEVERSYRQIMSASGMPAGFWDSHDDFTALIGGDMSPSELQRRVDYATEKASQIDDATGTWFREQYGLDFGALDRGELAAYLLDPERGMDVINRVMRGGRVAGAARSMGVGITKEQAERFGAAADSNQYSVQAAEFGQLAARGGFLADLYDGDYGVDRAGAEVFFGDVAAADERRRLQERERGTFSGGGMASTTALGSGPGAV